DTLAQNLLTSGVYGHAAGVPDASFPPLYPYLLAGIYATLGRGSFQIVLLNTVFDVSTISLLAQIGKRLLPYGTSVGLLAALFFAAYPYFAFQSLTVIDTSLFTMLLHAFILIMIELRDRKELDHAAWMWIGLGGVTLGLAALDRPIVAVIGLSAFAWFVLSLGVMPTIKRLIPVAVVSVLVIIPWNVRNYAVYHTFVNIATTTGMNFWYGNSKYTVPLLKAGYHTQWVSPDQPMNGLTPPEADRQLVDLGIRYLLDNPSQIPELLWVKFLAYWSISIFPSKNPASGGEINASNPGAGHLTVNDKGEVVLAGMSPSDPVTAYATPLFDQIGRVVHIIYFGSLLLLALIGLIRVRSAWRNVSFIWFIQISMTIIYVLFIPTTRYRVPTDSLLFLFSAWTLISLWVHYRKREFPAIRLFMPSHHDST
ncbi:MAG TPA: glycosyltransferase family 39 protein, partial [Aggregatilineaceae bacterium]|nr:glycosyltransferase family 39 protein [Aggregatilineaceae bacterium]